MSAAIQTHFEFDLHRSNRRGEPHECDGRMLVTPDEDEAWQWIQCDRCGSEFRQRSDSSAHVEQLAEQRRERCAIPLLYRRRGLDLPDDESERSRALREWARGAAEQPAMMLCGGTGVGKSQLAAAALWERAKVGPVLWIYVPALFDRLALAFGDEQRHEALREIAGSQTIVLDDIDKSGSTQFAGLELLNAIETRLTQGAGVLVTTNLRPSQLADKYGDNNGDAIVSRLRGYGETFVINGSDRRMERFAA